MEDHPDRGAAICQCRLRTRGREATESDHQPRLQRFDRLRQGSITQRQERLALVEW